MHSGVDLINRMTELENALLKSLASMDRYGKARADAEERYKVRLMQETLKLRDSGVPVTIIDKVVMGVVAAERRERDIADVNYKTSQERVNGIKLIIRTINDQINREWGNPNG